MFWGCPVAQAVCARLQRNLPAGSTLHPRHLWLLEPPCAAIHAAVWAAVGMAALTAIHRARNSMFRAKPAAAASRVQQQQQTQQGAQSSGRSAAQQLIINTGAASSAVAHFVRSVQDFVEAGRGSDETKALCEKIGAGHPFIHSVGPSDLQVCISL